MEAQAKFSPAKHLEQAVSITNNYIAKTHEQAMVFSTVFIGILDPFDGILTYINAGNEPPLVIHTDGTSEELRSTSPVVGTMPNVKYKALEVVLTSGDSLLAFTDGIADSKNIRNEFYGHERLATVIKQKDASAVDMVNHIGRELDEFIDTAEQFDDITILALRRV